MIASTVTHFYVDQPQAGTARKSHLLVHIHSTGSTCMYAGPALPIDHDDLREHTHHTDQGDARPTITGDGLRLARGPSCSYAHPGISRGTIRPLPLVRTTSATHTMSAQHSSLHHQRMRTLDATRSIPDNPRNAVRYSTQPRTLLAFPGDPGLPTSRSTPYTLPRHLHVTQKLNA